MKAKVKDRKKITKDTLFVTFDLLGKDINFKAGQYFYITIPKLNYPDSKGNTRHFSIVNSPSEKGIISMATRVREESGFKKTLRELPIGSMVEIGAITGNFTLPKSGNRPLVFVAGGIGITPFISILRHVTEEYLPYNITLIYSNRNQESSAFLDEIKKIKNKKIRLILIMTQDPAWKGENKRIDSQFIRHSIADFNSKTFYIAGPPSFNKAVSKSLKKLEIKNSNIVIEDFFGY